MSSPPCKPHGHAVLLSFLHYATTQLPIVYRVVAKGCDVDSLMVGDDVILFDQAIGTTVCSSESFLYLFRDSDVAAVIRDSGMSYAAVIRGSGMSYDAYDAALSG